MRLLAALIMILTALQLPGCVTLYRYQDVTIKVVDAETGDPIARATVEVSYGSMFEIHPPKAVEATTEADGLATVRAANFRGEFYFNVAAEGYIGAGDRATIRQRPSYDEFRWVVLPDGEVNTIALFAKPIPTGTFVLPQGFQGLLRFPRDADSGIEPQPGQREFTVHVGDDGIVHLPRAGVARHTEWESQYPDHTSIPKEDPLHEDMYPHVGRYSIGWCDHGGLEYVGDYTTARRIYIWVNRITFNERGGAYSTSDSERAGQVWEHGLSVIPK